MIYEKIRQDFDSARKSGDAQTVNALRVLIGEIQRLEKDLPDDRVVSVVKKLVKSVDETISSASDGTLVALLVEEKKVYENYLPKMLPEGVLRSLLNTYKNEDSLSLGDAMKRLKERYLGQYDGKFASAIYKELLNG